MTRAAMYLVAPSSIARTGAVLPAGRVNPQIVGKKPLVETSRRTKSRFRRLIRKGQAVDAGDIDTLELL